MKKLKPIHLVILAILALLSAAILQWTKFPQNAPAPSGPVAGSASAQNFRSYPNPTWKKLNAPPAFTKPLPPFEESPGSNLEPKNKARAGKAML